MCVADSLLGSVKQPRGFGSQHFATVNVTGLQTDRQTETDADKQTDRETDRKESGTSSIQPPDVPDSFTFLYQLVLTCLTLPHHSALSPVPCCLISSPVLTLTSTPVPDLTVPPVSCLSICLDLQLVFLFSLSVCIFSTTACCPSSLLQFLPVWIFSEPVSSWDD